jgi:hypothetical protein
MCSWFVSFHHAGRFAAKIIAILLTCKSRGPLFQITLDRFAEVWTLQQLSLGIDLKVLALAQGEMVTLIDDSFGHGNGARRHFAKLIGQGVNRCVELIGSDHLVDQSVRVRRLSVNPFAEQALA